MVLVIGTIKGRKNVTQGDGGTLEYLYTSSYPNAGKLVTESAAEVINKDVIHYYCSIRAELMSWEIRSFLFFSFPCLLIFSKDGRLYTIMMYCTAMLADRYLHVSS